MFRIFTVASTMLMFLTLLVASGAFPNTAKACGGFFCSANAPVNQAAERIIFSKNADNTVTAVVQIQYSGPSEDFAWVLPVPGIPDIDVSSDLAFTRLQNASNPQYNLTVSVEGECRSNEVASDNGGAGGSGGFADAGADAGTSVDVLAEGNVGPYDYVVIQPDEGASDAGAVAVQWLINEGYDVVPPGGDQQAISTMLGSYLSGGMNLIAFRLTKENGAGTIRPIRMTYATERPMIPIRPTAVAANDDMGVLVWVLGESRAVTVNYKTLELNESLINWLNGGQNYNQVVIAAANEAGGQGFVTERAGASSDYDKVIFTQFDADGWSAFSSTAASGTAGDALVESASRFGVFDGLREAVESRLPDGVDIDIDEFLQCPGCARTEVMSASFNISTFVTELEETVIDPMRDTQALLDSRPYVSRMYTTMSAPEMDRDPEFDFNTEVADVSNVHNANRIIECNPSVSRFEAPWRVELAGGNTVRGMGNTWPLAIGTDELPANARILQLSTTGEGIVDTDNADTIGKALDDHNATIPRRPGISGGGGWGCTIHAAPSPFALTVLLLAVLLVMTRRFEA